MRDPKDKKLFTMGLSKIPKTRGLWFKVLMMIAPGKGMFLLSGKYLPF